MQVTYVNKAVQLEQYGRPPAIPAEYSLMPAAIVTGLQNDEPVFVLRARDALALATLNFYRSISEGLFADQRAMDLEADVAKFIEWRQARQELVRDPD